MLLPEEDRQRGLVGLGFFVPAYGDGQACSGVAGAIFHNIELWLWQKTKYLNLGKQSNLEKHH